jgi:hypothetical protein
MTIPKMCLAPSNGGACRSNAGTRHSFERTGTVFGSLVAMIAALHGLGEPYVAPYDEKTVTLKGA